MKRRAIAYNLLGALSNFAFLFLTSLVLLPYYFKFIDITDYGIWLGGISFLSIVSILEANISLILTQLLGDKWTNNKPVEFSKYLTSAVLFGVAASILIIGLTFFFKDSLTSWVSPNKQIEAPFANSFFLYSISLSFTITFGYMNCVTQVFLKTLWSPVFNIIASIIGIAYTLWTLPTQGILAIAAGNLVKVVIYSVLVSIYVIKLLKQKSIPFYFELSYLLKLLKNISLPFVSKIGMTLAVSIQNFIVATTISATATTIFDITRKLPLITQMVINMIAVSTFSSFTLLYSEQKNSEGIHEYTIHYFSIIRILLLFSLTFIFIIGHDFVKLWVGLDKFGGNIILALICITTLTDQLRMMLAQQYYATGRFNLTSITDTIFAVSFMGIAFFIIPYLKLEGIVIAGLLANVIYFVSCFGLEKRNNVNMVPHIINWHFLYDLLLFVIVISITKYIYEFYSGNIKAGVMIILVAFTALSFIYYIKEKTLFNFLVHKLWRKSPLQQIN